MEPRDFKEALNKAKRALHKYYRENHLDPAKDYSKDPIHGDMVTNLILRLNKERDKLERKFPIIKIKSNLKFVRTMAKNIKEAKASKKEKKVKATVTEEVETKKSKKEKKESTKKPCKYDYPLIDGREMNSIEKKKYRMEQRKLKAKEGKEESKESKPTSKKAKKESKESKPTSKKAKKEETSKKVKKEKTYKDVKKKKVKKEED